MGPDIMGRNRLRSKATTMLTITPSTNTVPKFWDNETPTFLLMKKYIDHKTIINIITPKPNSGRVISTPPIAE